MGMQIRWEKYHQSEKSCQTWDERGNNLSSQEKPKGHKEVHRSFSLKSQGDCMKGSVSGCYGDLGSLPPASQLLGSLGDFTQQVIFVSWGFLFLYAATVTVLTQQGL